MTGIEGKVVAITWASSGIGQATAILLAQRGAKLVLGARNSARLEALTERITDAGGHYGRTDVTRRGDLTELVAVAQQPLAARHQLAVNTGLPCRRRAL